MFTDYDRGPAYRPGEGGAAPAPSFAMAAEPLFMDLPTFDWDAMRLRLGHVCDPAELLGYMAEQFAQPGYGCRHTFALVDAYFAQDPQQALAAYQVLGDLGVRCDCEAFFVLRALTSPPGAASGPRHGSAGD